MVKFIINIIINIILLLFNCRLHAMDFATVDSHLLTVFAVSNLTHCPILHSGYLQFNVALLF